MPSAKPKHQIAVSAIVQRGGAFLLVQRKQEPHINHWAFPGGKVEPGESCHEAVLRELAEETGLAGQCDGVFDVFDFSGTSDGGLPFHTTLIVFFVRVDDVSDLKVASDAITAQWFTPVDAAQLPMPASMREAFARLTQM